ncbi:MAG: hypothetical protein ACE14P_08360 [Methanotrichaceae archaeon]
MRGGKDLRKAIFALLALYAITCMAAAEGADDNSTYNNPTSMEEGNLIFNLDQRVSGTGFFATYKYSLMPDVLGTEGRLFNGAEGKNRAHGSGRIDIDSIMHAESSYSNKTWENGAYDEDGEVIDTEEESTGIVQMKEDSDETYSPIAMVIGSSYYALNPITFNSLLSEEDWIKNRNSLSSLSHRINGAHGLKEALDAQSIIQSDTADCIMNIDENLIDGRAHFGAIQLAGIPVDEVPEDADLEEEGQSFGYAMKVWSKPLIKLDEDYVGTFHLVKNMTLHSGSEEKEKEDGWLSCCSGGWDSMPYYDRTSYGKSAKGVFDCTCFNSQEWRGRSERSPSFTAG